MSAMKYSDVFFKIGTKIKPVVCPGVETGTKLATSVARRRSKLNPSASMGPSISRVANAMDAILLKELQAVYNADTGEVYCESKTGKGFSAFYDGSSRMYTSGSVDSIAIMFTLSVIARNESSLSECREAMSDVIDEFGSKAMITPESMGYICDVVYYNTKDIVPGFQFEVERMDGNIVRQVQQAIRTGHLVALDKPLNAYVGTNFTSVKYEVVKEDDTATASTVKTVFLDRCKAHEFEIPGVWDEESKNRIVPVEFLDTYVPNKAFVSAVQLVANELRTVSDRIAIGKTGKAAIGKNYANMIFVGKPGTGKTTTAEALSAATGLPIYTCRLSKNTEEDEFEGMTKVSKGDFVLKDTEFLTGFTKGGIIVLEEFNLADPAVMQGALGQAIESPFMLMKDGVDIVYRHPMTVIIGTMNVATQGSREPNEAFTSRLPFTFPIEDPNDNDFVSILQVASGCKKSDCSKVYKTYKNILDYIKTAAGDEEFAMCITMRHCLACLKLMQFESFDDAVYNTMIGAIMIRDLAMAEDIFSNAVLAVAK